MCVFVRGCVHAHARVLVRPIIKMSACMLAVVCKGPTDGFVDTSSGRTTPFPGQLTADRQSS